MQKTMMKSTFAVHWKKWLLSLFLIAISAIWILPFCWIFSTSLRTPKNSFALPPSFFPTEFQWANYKQVFSALPFFEFFLNSVKVTLISVIAQCLFSAMAAYAFSRLTFKGKKSLFILILTGLMLPSQVTIVPVFLMIKQLHLMDTHLALILPSIIFPLGIFLLRQSMMTIPKSYEEAAYIDGAGYFRIFWSIILPISTPSLIVVALMHFIAVWNDFFKPLILINTYEKMTLPLGLTVLNGFMGNGNVSVIMAGVILSLIIPLLVYILGQQKLVEGMAMAGIKG